MSLVGTRPILQDELQKYELHHRARIAIKPGITGMWQVSGRSDITDFEEVVRLDTEYISNWNFGLDIKILFKTVMTVLKREGSPRKVFGLISGCLEKKSFLSIRQRLSRWRLIRSKNTTVERTEEIPSATGSAKKVAFAPKKEGRTAALITKRDFLVTESASPVFGHSRAVSPSTKTYWKLSGMIISV